MQLNLEDNEVAYLLQVLQSKCLLGEALGVFLKINQQATMQQARGNGLAPVEARDGAERSAEM